MIADQAFSVSNGVAVAGWLMLILGSRARWVAEVVTGAMLPLLFAVLYAGLLAAHWGAQEGGFGSISEVQALFSNQWLLLAGWVHYLAFDLFIGSWQVRDAWKHGIPHLALIPGLILMFVFGPVGLLLYFVMRVVKMRRVSAGLHIIQER